MFRKAGIEPPGNWEEFMEAAKAMTSKDCYGFVMSAVAEEQSSFQILPWLLSGGDDLQHLGEEGSVRAFAMFQHLVETGCMPKDCINWSQIDVARQFAAGKCAMMENGPWALPLAEAAGVDYGVVKLPVAWQQAAVAGGENLAVVRGKNRDGALALIAYYYQDDVMLAINQQMYSLPPLSRLADKLKEENPVFCVFEEQMENCISRSSYPQWPQITGVLSEALYGVITEELSPQKAAYRIKNRVHDG